MLEYEIGLKIAEIYQKWSIFSIHELPISVIDICMQYYLGINGFSGSLSEC